MFNVLRIFIISFFLYQGSFAQNLNAEIYWTKERKLTWADYRGIPDMGSIHGAISMTGIYYKSSFKKDTLILTVHAGIDKKKSWVKMEYNTNIDLLLHEQGHFDLSELYGRKLRKALVEFKFSTDKQKASKEAKYIYMTFYNELNEANVLYDKETNFSIDTVNQAEWTKKIKKEITALDQYSSSTVKILIH